MFSTSQIQNNYTAVRERVALAAERVGRAAEDVLLLPVSKMHPAHSIEALYELGVRDFGESRVQELLKKQAALPEDIRWHFIGNLQSNKVRQIVDFVHLIHSVHSLPIAQEISKRANRIVDVLLEVGISGEATKSGIAPEHSSALIESIGSACANVRIIGLMGMASYETEVERTRAQFRVLANVLREMQTHGLKPVPRELSMGMTNDYEVAIEEGATIVRVGSAIFGEREY